MGWASRRGLQSCNERVGGGEKSKGRASWGKSRRGELSVAGMSTVGLEPGVEGFVGRCKSYTEVIPDLYCTPNAHLLGSPSPVCLLSAILSLSFLLSTASSGHFARLQVIKITFSLAGRCVTDGGGKLGQRVSTRAS